MRKLPALTQPCGMRARSAAQATVRALGRTRLGRPSFPTVSSGPKEQRPVPVLLLRPQLILGTSPKIQGVRSEARAEQRLAAGGAAPPTRTNFRLSLSN